MTQTVFQIMFGIIIAGLVAKILLDRGKDSKAISSSLKALIDQTEYLNIASKTYRYFPINFGSEFNRCKFCFTDNDIFLVGTNNQPFVLNPSADSKYSYFTKFEITQFSFSNSNLKIEFQNKTLIGTKMTLYISDISEKDKSTLLKYIKQT